ncbi:MAG: hypothetical protein HQ463_04655 [Bacteroidetes bacterium]|nr:hypothetical protein [Bacteroidota bacterium]
MKKAAEVKAELYPLSKKEFEDLYNKAWEYGWVYGKFFQELYDEYLVNWVYFVDYLDVLKGVNRVERMYKRIQHNFVIVSAKNQNPIIIEAKDFYLKLFPKENVKKEGIISDVEILIGEAPPYWKGNAKNNEKSYFYNPKQTKKSPWLNAPFNWKGGNLIFPMGITKQQKLEFLASKGIVLIDFLPFPIIQDTKVRQNITGGFSYLLSNYFINKYNEITRYINNSKEKPINFLHGFVATTYTSLQFIFDDSVDENAKKFRNEILTSPIENNNIVVLNFGAKNEMIKVSETKSGGTIKYKPLFKFIYELYTRKKFNSTNTDIYNTINKLNTIGLNMKCPIFMVEGGSVNMNNSFFNSKNDNLRKEEINKINSDLIDSNNEIDE